MLPIFILILNVKLYELFRIVCGRTRRLTRLADDRTVTRTQIHRLLVNASIFLQEVFMNTSVSRNQSLGRSSSKELSGIIKAHASNENQPSLMMLLVLHTYQLHYLQLSKLLRVQQRGIADGQRSLLFALFHR